MPGLRGLKGRNINGPTLIKVPTWIENALGKYYLYFSHHQGKYIRLAYSDCIEGPYTIFKPGTLHNKYPFLKSRHIASPEIFIDEEKKEIRMYFHANIRSDSSGPFGRLGQMSYGALSKDGINFEPNPEQLAPFYLRIFLEDDFFFGIAKNGNSDAILVRSKSGMNLFEKGPHFMKHFRHCGLLRQNNQILVFFTKAFDAPERIYVSKMFLEGNWKKWCLTKPIEVLRAETEWEGGNLPVTRSKYGTAKKSNALRDPFIYEEEGRFYLFYCVKGEGGIAVAEIVID
jgi:hypothetical protein